MSGGEPKSSRSPWTKVFSLFVILALSGVIVFLSFVWLGHRTIDSAQTAAVEIITAFKPEEVVETFEEWREMEATATEGNILEVATATATEKFSRKTNLEMLGRTLPLGTTVSEISVPATYRYHIDINGDWFLTSDGNRLLVLCPELKPSLPVAFDTGKMQKKSTSGWARWDKAVNLDELEQTITSRLEKRASDEDVLARIREESRIAVAQFVRNWLLNREAWADDKFEEIVVVFSGEDDVNLSGAPATLRFTEIPPETIDPLLD